MKASTHIHLVLSLDPANPRDQGPLRRAALAVQRFLEANQDVRAQLCNAAAGADENLFPSDFIIGVEYDGHVKMEDEQ